MHYTLTLSKSYFNNLNENHSITNRNAVKEISTVTSAATPMEISFNKYNNGNDLGDRGNSKNSVRKRHEVNAVYFQNKLKRGKMRCLRSLGICKHQKDITFGLISR